MLDINTIVPRESTSIHLINTGSPSLWRHFAAILYDSILLIGLLMLAAALLVVPLGFWGVEVEILRQHWAFRLYLFLVVPVVFFCGFWIHGGQTLGMRTWHIQVVCVDGSPLNFKIALLRLAAANLSWLCLGVGFFWSLVDKKGRTWHDLLSGTRLILVEPLTRQSVIA